MVKHLSGSLSGTGLSIAVITTRWNEFITDRLRDSALQTLAQHGVEEATTYCVTVPGAYEVPFTAKKLALTGKFDAIAALGCVIRGATAHFDFVAGEAATGCARVGHETGVPVIFGVLTVDTIEQAIERAGTKAGNKGAETAAAAVEMANLTRMIEDL